MGTIFRYIKNMIKYMKSGGVVYYNVANLNPSSILLGKVVLITGGSSGFGLQMAKDLIMAGAKVIITGRNESKLEDAKKQINSDNLRTIIWDAENIINISNNMDSAISIFGKIDVFVNNAGVFSKTHGLDTKIDDWNTVIATNLTGVFFMMQAQAKYLRDVYDELGGGKIINITSVGAFKPKFDSYYIAKKAVSFMSEGLARELAPYNICVNCIAPGEALTSPEMCSYYGKTGDNNFYPNQPNHRFTRVEDIASMVLYLASDLSNNITGEHIAVDGGWFVNH